MVFEDPLGYFSIEAPEAWIELELDEAEGQILYTLDPESNIELFVVEEHVLALGLGELTLDEYADLIETSVLIPAGAEDITRELVQTQQGVSSI